MKKRFVLAVFAFAFFTCIVFAEDNSYCIVDSYVEKCSKCAFAYDADSIIGTAEKVSEITSVEETTAVRETEHIMENFPVIIQTPELPTGCEITAATMMMNYYSFNADKILMANEYLPKTEDKNLHYHDDGKLYGVDLNGFFYR